MENNTLLQEQKQEKKSKKNIPKTDDEKKIKSREAQARFRKKERELMDKLEKEVNDYTMKNTKLNDQIQYLSTENNMIKDQMNYLRQFIAKAFNEVACFS
eukprot:TRINITY_DN917_c0_g3_i1.p2 TRINITY_DN917_c0_g3~~TRINITY_DN917_c0_g3_i1.p2  ORF type:complete len:100 (+),score=24.95 TRINITY_DN917_c0_g3_i1:77-376(+)